MEKVNIIVGRFQPFTNGHLKCIKDVYNKHGLRTVILIIDSKVNDKHPFNKEILTTMLNKVVHFYGKYCAGFIFVKNADIVLNSESVRNYGYEPISWVCGTDRYLPYQNMVDKYSLKANLSPNFKLLCVNRTSDDISATSVRNALKMGNYGVFKTNVPHCLHNMENVFIKNV